MLVGLKYKGRTIKIPDVKKLSKFSKFIGLMFSRRENARALLFEFNRETKTSIHSLFVFFPFIAVWLDDKNKIIEIRKISSWKFSVKPEKNFKKLIEIPANKKYSKIIKLLVGKRKIYK